MLRSEANPQSWRAVAVFDDRGDRLLYLGRSSSQVRAEYTEAFYEVLEAEERDHVRSLSLQRWQGAPEAGRWIHQANLIVPVTVRLSPRV
jgi:hypothetical protein